MLKLNEIWKMFTAENDIRKKYVLYLCYRYRGGKRDISSFIKQAFNNLDTKEFTYTMFTILYCTKKFYTSGEKNVDYLLSDWNRCLNNIGFKVTGINTYKQNILNISLNCNYGVQFNEHTWFSNIISWFKKLGGTDELMELVDYVQLKVVETGAI